MTLGYVAEHRLRRSHVGPLDYDDGPIPAQVAARVLDWPSPGPRASRALGLAVHWGYGSLVGVAAMPLVRRQAPAAATAEYFAGITVMASALFPTLGGTPPPWRWEPDVVATSLFQHLVYAAVVAAVLRRLTPPAESDPAAGPV